MKCPTATAKSIEAVEKPLGERLLKALFVAAGDFNHRPLPLTVDLGQTYNLDGATQTTLLHSYAFDAASTFSATTAVTAPDNSIIVNCEW